MDMTNNFPTELGGDRLPMQVMAGSATASRAAFDQLNRALSSASMEGGVIDSVGIKDEWGGMMKVC